MSHVYKSKCVISLRFIDGGRLPGCVKQNASVAHLGKHGKVTLQRTFRKINKMKQKMAGIDKATGLVVIN